MRCGSGSRLGATMLPSVALFLTLFSSLLGLTTARSPYSEHLHLQPLPHSLLAQFEFSSTASDTSLEEQNFRFFPRSLSQILHHAHTKELHLRFTSGRWDEESWGRRPRNGAREGGTGIEMWAWVDGETESVAYTRWLALVNSLSGLFCASLNYIDSTRTTMPIAAFEPEGYSVNGTHNLHLFHGTLPREVVCTENLTPFMKMLPCKGKAGVSSLLDGHKIFDAAWQSMAIDVRPVQLGGSSARGLQMEQSIDMVLDIERSMRPKDDPIPRPYPQDQMLCDKDKWYNQYGDSCYPVEQPPFPDFTLEQVFGRKLKGTCPLIDDANDKPTSICVAPAGGQTVEIKSAGAYKETKSSGQRCFRMPIDADFDVEFMELITAADYSPPLPKLRVERTISGYGQQRGGLKSVIVNPLDEPVDFVYLETLPWFMKPFIHTLQTTVSSSLSQGEVQTFRAPTREEVINDMHYQPGIDRQRAAHLELKLRMPPQTKLTLTYDFEKSVLRYTEYPPDANRGFDVAPAVIRILPSKPDEPSSYVRSTSLLIYAASPDFSMPYNVIILTSTVIALGFGSVFNLLVRRLVGAHETGPGGGIKERIRGRIAAIRAKLGAKKKTQ
ncbi:hypothetical protein FH972_023313 [Carpinus fangiana]|uniref:Uncharacterized protein n=1 Tax=Carpinus fangiana TaxID=176857 RepID=A0A5N6KUV4_9ROSI|nr:hypothetical protein FH972_023313 [Carpinus fangiana]